MSKRLEDYEIITKKDILDNEVLYKDILSELEQNRTEWYQFVSEKREQFLERQKKLTKPDVYKTSHIKIHTAQQQKKAFISTFYNNDLNVSFSWRDMWDDEQAEKIEMLAKYDKKVMWKDKKDFKRLDYIFDYGVWIEIKTGYDDIRQVPMYEVVNPMYWVPDRLWNAVDNNFEYHIFEMITTINQLKGVNLSWDVYFNLEDIEAWALRNKTSEDIASHRLLNAVEDRRRTIEIHTHYVTLNERKYIVTTTNTRSLIIRFEEIKAITSEEKKNHSLVEFPVVITNKYPLDNDPFWLSDLELILDKQNAINRIANLSLMKEEYDAWFKHVAVDIDRLSNPNLLKQQPEWWPIFVPFRWKEWSPVSNATSPIETFSTVSQGSYAMTQYLEGEAGKETLFTEANRWIAQPNQTLWQAKMQQQNSNLVFGLDADMLSIGIQRFWRIIWYRSLQNNFKWTQEKIFRIGNWLFGKTIKFKKADMISGYDPDIVVKSKRQEQEENREKLAYMMAQRPLLQQDPNVPQVSKNIFKRKLDGLNWVPRDLVYAYTPLTRDEHRALNYVELINNEITPKNMFQPWMDYETYWIYITHANNNKTKAKVIWLLEDVMLEEWVWKPQEQSQQQWWVANSMWSQLTSWLMQQQKDQWQQQSLQWLW